MQGSGPTGPFPRSDAEARARLDEELERLAPRRATLGTGGVFSVAGWTLTHAMEWEAAVLAWSRAAESSPDDWEPVHQEGICLLELGRWDDAADRFRRAIEMDARLVALGRPGVEWMEDDPAYRLGMALHAKGDLRAALVAYEESAVRNNTGVDALREMARCRLALVEPEEAIVALVRLERRAVRHSVRGEMMALRAEATRLLGARGA